MDRPSVSPRRITLVGPFWPYRGGIAHFLVAMARGLAKRGHSIRTTTFRRQYPETLFPGKTQLDEGAAPDDVPRAARQLDTMSPLTWVRTARSIWREGVDVVVFKYWMSFFAPAFGTLARWLRRRGVTVLCVVDNAIPHERRPGDITMGRYVLGACDGLIVMSEKVQRDVERLGGGAEGGIRYGAHGSECLGVWCVVRASTHPTGFVWWGETPPYGFGLFAAQADDDIDAGDFRAIGGGWNLGNLELIRGGVG